MLFTHHERLKLQRAQFTNDRIVNLQQVAYQVVCSAEEKRISEQEDELERMREKREKPLLPQQVTRLTIWNALQGLPTSIMNS